MLVGDRVWKRPPVGRPDDVSTLQQPLDEQCGEQRMPIRLALDQAGQLVREVIGCEPRVEVALDMLTREHRQRELFTPVASDQLVTISLQRMVSVLDVFRSERANNEQPLVSDALAEIPEQVDAGCVGPVQVFEDEHDGHARGELGEGVAQLPQHPVLGRADRLLLELGARVAGSEGRRKLKAPHRRMTPEDGGHPGATRSRQQRAERVEERQGGLPGPVLLDASPADDEKCLWATPGAEYEFIHQRRLADPGFAGDQERAPACRDRLREGIVELSSFPLPTHDVPGRRCNLALGRDPTLGRTCHDTL